MNGSDVSIIWVVSGPKFGLESSSGTVFPTLPETFPVDYIEGGKSGVWKDDVLGQKQMTLLLDLGMWINGLDDFMHRPEYRPFLRVFRTNENEVAKSSWEERWSNKSSDELIMRTSSFRLGHQRLDMWIREGDLGRDDHWAESNNQWPAQMQTGITEDRLVPFATVSAIRLLLGETRLGHYGSYYASKGREGYRYGGDNR